MITHSRVGVCSWSLQPASARELVEKLLACGVAHTQLDLRPLLDGLWSEIETVNRLRGAGIEAVSGMVGFRGEDYSTLETIMATGGVRLDEHWEHNLAMARGGAQMAARLGLKLVTFHAGFIPHERGAERTLMIERLRRVIDTFDDRGVRVGFETGQESSETLLDALDDLARPHVGVNFDPANMILYAMGDPIASLRALLSRTVQVHIKDANATPTPGTWGREVRAGEGEVRWSEFFKVLREGGSSVDRLIEREAGGSRIEDVRIAAEMVKQLS